MIPFRPEAKSELLRASRILHIRVESVQEGAFQIVSPRFQQRDVTLRLVLLAALKGYVQERPGDPIEIRVVQTENIGVRFTAVPGVYSRLELATGLELVAFAGEEGTNAAEALNDPVCFFIATGRAVLDVSFADEAGNPELRLATLLDRLRERRAMFGFLFARYLMDRLPEAFSEEDTRDLDAVLEVLKAPELDGSTRYVICEGVVTAALLDSPLRPDLLQSVVQSLFRLLLLPEAADLHENLVTTWIPNLLGIEGESEQLVPHEVFPDNAFQRQVVVAIRHLADESAAAPLLGWLGS